MFRDILESAGHEVYAAASGPEGLELLERQAVDLVCTDLGMPGMTGWEVAERIKAHSVDLLIAKPFQIKEILREVE